MCCSCRAARSCSRAIPKTLPREHGKATLEELFIAVAREPLALRTGMTHEARDARVAIVLRQFYLSRQPRARPAAVRLGRGRHRAVGLHHRYLNTVRRPGFNFVPALLGAVLLWDFFTRVMQGVTMAFFEDVWSRNFLNIFATPLSIPEYLGRPGALEHRHEHRRPGRDAGAGDHGVRPVVPRLWRRARCRSCWCCSFSASRSGSSASALVLRLGSGGGVVRLADPGLVSPFAGVFYPLSTLPAVDAGRVARLLPPSYVFEGMRGIVVGAARRLAPPLALGRRARGLLPPAGVLFFARVYRYAVRTGLIARYSAESVS